MTSAIQSQINRIAKEVANLRTLDAKEAKKEADLLGKIHRAQAAASSARNMPTLQSKLRDVEHFSKDIATLQKKRADIAKKMSDNSRTLGSLQDKQRREEEKARKKAVEAERKLMREREAHQRRLRSQQPSQPLLANVEDVYKTPTDTFDFFICHASEDKEGFVRELAEILKKRGARIWYDEFTLQIGDSLRRKIDRGLISSRFGIVILSENFFKKEWPQRELDGLVTLESQGRDRILPIWYKVTKDKITALSPTLADKVALNTSSYGIQEIVDKLMAKIDSK